MSAAAAVARAARASGTNVGAWPHLERLESRLMLSTWYVDDDVRRSGDGLSAERAFDTIADALSAARAGDVIKVLDGRYVENLRITKEVQILGAGADKTVLMGSDKTRPAVTFDYDQDAHPSYVFWRKPVILDGFTILEGWSATGRPVDILDGSSGISISNSVLNASHVAEQAILVRGSASRLVFNNNVIRYHRVGIDVPDGYAASACDISILDSTFIPSPAAAAGESIAIRLDRAHDVIIAGNLFVAPQHVPTDANRAVAVLAWGVKNLVFKDNVVLGVDRVSACLGVRLLAVLGEVVVVGNEFAHLLTGVMLTQSAEGATTTAVTVGMFGKGNSFTGNGAGIIVVDDGVGVLARDFAIAANVFRDNDVGLLVGDPLVVAGTDSQAGLIFLHDNDFGVCNGVAVRSFEVDPDTDRMAPECNWFGNVTGAAHPSNPAGQGAVVVGQFELDEPAVRGEPRVDLAVCLVESRATLTCFPVPGDLAFVPVLITNVGDLPALGKAEVRVFLSLDGVLDETADILIGAQSARVLLSGGFARLIRVPVAVGDIAPGAYRLIARLEPAGGIGQEAALDNNTAEGVLTYNVQRCFGEVPGRRLVVPLRLLHPVTGNVIIFRLVGSGSAIVDQALNITITGTTRRTTLIITTSPNEPLVLGDITVNGALNAFLAGGGDLQGTLSIIGGGARLIRVGTITGGSINVTGAVGRIQTAHVTGGGTITVDTLGRLLVAGRRGATPLNGDFQASLVANNFADRPIGIHQVLVAGSAVGGSIKVLTGSLAFVLVRDWLDDFGIFVAGSVGVVIADAMRHSAILAGSNATQTGIDPLSARRIQRVIVTGRDRQDGVSFINTILLAPIVDFAWLANVNPINAGSAPPKGIDPLPTAVREFGVFVSDDVGVIRANAFGERARVFRQPGDEPALPPDFYVRRIV